MTYAVGARVRRPLISRLVLRIQGSSFIRPPLRRRLLNLAGARIHRTAIVERGCSITHRLRMGPGSLLNVECSLYGDEWLTIEENARVAMQSVFLTRTHAIADDPNYRQGWVGDVSAPIRVGRGSWVGTRAVVMPGVRIAPGCVIGAGALVDESTQPDGVYVNAAGPSGAVRARRVRDLPQEADARPNVFEFPFSTRSEA